MKIDLNVAIEVLCTSCAYHKHDPHACICGGTGFVNEEISLQQFVTQTCDQIKKLKKQVRRLRKRLSDVERNSD